MKEQRMIEAVCGFFCGFVIPYMARRFAKIMPAASSVIIWQLLVWSKSVSAAKRRQNETYRQLRNIFLYRSLLFGALTAILFAGAGIKFDEGGLVWINVFIWAMLLLFEIDFKTMLLPDVVTVPLLIAGFLFSILYGVWTFPADSAAGAACGYLIPVLSGLLIVKRHPDAIGGGDIKLLAAIGAWLGMINVIYVILLSCLLFAGFAVVSKKRAGAFGPAVVSAAIIVAFYFL